jgi:hypothetical protein
MGQVMIDLYNLIHMSRCNQNLTYDIMADNFLLNVRTQYEIRG